MTGARLLLALSALAAGARSNLVKSIGGAAVRRQGRSTAVLRDANLSHAGLDYTDFANADLSGAIFAGAEARAVSFCGTDLRGAALPDRSRVLAIWCDAATRWPNPFEPADHAVYKLDSGTVEAILTVPEYARLHGMKLKFDTRYDVPYYVLSWSDGERYNRIQIWIGAESFDVVLIQQKLHFGVIPSSEACHNSMTICPPPENWIRLQEYLERARSNAKHADER